MKCVNSTTLFFEPFRVWLLKFKSLKTKHLTLDLEDKAWNSGIMDCCKGLPVFLPRAGGQKSIIPNSTIVFR